MSSTDGKPSRARTGNGAESSNNHGGGTRSRENRPTGLLGNRNISIHRPSSQTGVVATAFNNRGGGTNSGGNRVFNLVGPRDISSLPSSALTGNGATASTNSRRGTNSPGNQNSFAPPPSRPSAQTGVFATASNNQWEGTNSRAETLISSRDISSRLLSATSSTDRAFNLTKPSTHPPSGSSAQTVNVATASNNSRRGTNSRAETLVSSRDISSRQLSATSSNNRAANPSVSSDQTGRRNTASNIPGGGTNSRGNKSASLLDNAKFSR